MGQICSSCTEGDGEGNNKHARGLLTTDATMDLVAVVGSFQTRNENGGVSMEEEKCRTVINEKKRTASRKNRELSCVEEMMMVEEKESGDLPQSIKDEDDGEEKVQDEEKKEEKKKDGNAFLEKIKGLEQKVEQGGLFLTPESSTASVKAHNSANMEKAKRGVGGEVGTNKTTTVSTDKEVKRVEAEIVIESTNDTKGFLEKIKGLENKIEHGGKKTETGSETVEMTQEPVDLTSNIGKENAKPNRDKSFLEKIKGLEKKIEGGGKKTETGDSNTISSRRSSNSILDKIKGLENKIENGGKRTEADTVTVSTSRGLVGKIEGLEQRIESGGKQTEVTADDILKKKDMKFNSPPPKVVMTSGLSEIVSPLGMNKENTCETPATDADQSSKVDSPGEDCKMMTDSLLVLNKTLRFSVLDLNNMDYSFITDLGTQNDHRSTETTVKGGNIESNKDYLDGKTIIRTAKFSMLA